MKSLSRAGGDQRFGRDDQGLVERLLPFLRRRFEVRDLRGPGRAVGDRLAQHHHLGQLADRDRRHRQPERLAPGIAERSGLRVSDRACSSGTWATGARPNIRRSCAGSTPDPQENAPTVVDARPLHVRWPKRSAWPTCRSCRSSRRRNGPPLRAARSSRRCRGCPTCRSARSGTRRPCPATCPAGPTSARSASLRGSSCRRCAGTAAAPRLRLRGSRVMFASLARWPSSLIRSLRSWKRSFIASICASRRSACGIAKRSSARAQRGQLVYRCSHFGSPCRLRAASR